jgi:hypothetical protein
VRQGLKAHESVDDVSWCADNKCLPIAIKIPSRSSDDDLRWIPTLWSETERRADVQVSTVIVFIPLRVDDDLPRLSGRSVAEYESRRDECAGQGARWRVADEGRWLSFPR